MREQVVQSAGAAAIVDEQGRHSLEGGIAIEDGDAVVIATSGTTGEPRCVVLTHAAVETSARITSAALGVTAGDHWLACLPLAHIGGLSVVTRALLTGTRLTVHPMFNADTAMDSGATLVSLVTAAMRRINTDKFRKILLGGGPVPAEKPSNAVATYGMTETGSGIVYDGYPLSGVQLRSDGDDIVSVKSPTLLRCYRDGTDPLDAGGWFKTGDAGRIGRDGKLTIEGRADELIITGGEKVWPQAVELVISAHPGIDAVVVTGESDDEWGQRVIATIEATGANVHLDELRELVKEQLPAYCAPRELRIVEELPRTGSGKVRRPTYR